MEALLEMCTALREDMITTFDACLALKPHRKDIIELFMRTGHAHMCDVLGRFWELRAVEFNPFETLALADWTYRYSRDLRKFGISDDSLESGYLQLCTAYAKKTHAQITPLVVNILRQEREVTQVETDPKQGFLYTNAPFDLIKMFSESFEVVLAKRIKELILKTLRMFYNLMQQFQRALTRWIEAESQRLPHDFLIAQCNNFFLFFEQMEDMLTQVRDLAICSEDEIEAHFSQRNIQQAFQRVQTKLI